MRSKRNAVLSVISRSPGVSLTSRDIGRAVKLTASQAAYYLSRLANEGLVERIIVDKREYLCLWRYPAKSESEAAS